MVTFDDYRLRIKEEVMDGLVSIVHELAIAGKFEVCCDAGVSKVLFHMPTTSLVYKAGVKSVLLNSLPSVSDICSLTKEGLIYAQKKVCLYVDLSFIAIDEKDEKSKVQRFYHREDEGFFFKNVDIVVVSNSIRRKHITIDTYNLMDVQVDLSDKVFKVCNLVNKYDIDKFLKLNMTFSEIKYATDGGIFTDNHPRMKLERFVYTRMVKGADLTIGENHWLTKEDESLDTVFPMNTVAWQKNDFFVNQSMATFIRFRRAGIKMHFSYHTASSFTYPRFSYILFMEILEDESFMMYKKSSKEDFFRILYFVDDMYSTMEFWDEYRTLKHKLKELGEKELLDKLIYVGGKL